MNTEHMLVKEDKPMAIYKANVKIRINSTITNTWVEISATNANVAKALLQAQYGKENIIAVIRKHG